MDVVVKRARAVAGRIAAPPSKSMAHRAVLCAALAKGTSHLHHLAFSKDISATLGAAARLCARVTTGENDAVVEGLGRFLPVDAPVDCCESGSTLRFLIPLAGLTGQEVTFTGRGRLMERPQEPYFVLFREKSIFYEQKDGVLTVRGKLTPGDYTLPGNVSSQFITGLLYALPLLEGNSRILLTTDLESRGYVDMTLDALEQFGVKAEYDGARTFHVPGNQYYQHRDLAIEADWSNAAFWYGAVSLGCQVDIQGLNAYSVQGDMRIVPYFMKLQGEGPVDLDVSQCPDLVPPLAAMAALRAGETTRIVNAGRLRIKESDRLATVTEVLNALGGQVEEYEDYLVIHGQEKLAGGVTVSGHNDHRVVMSLAVLALAAGLPVTIDGAEAVAKSWPDFFDAARALGAEVNEYAG